MHTLTFIVLTLFYLKKDAKLAKIYRQYVSPIHLKEYSTDYPAHAFSLASDYYSYSSYKPPRCSSSSGYTFENVLDC